jgi:hypothetical protein
LPFICTKKFRNAGLEFPWIVKRLVRKNVGNFLQNQRLSENFACPSPWVPLYPNQGAGPGFGSVLRACPKEHHVSDGPSHRGGRESLRTLKRDYVFTAEQFPPD